MAGLKRRRKMYALWLAGCMMLGSIAFPAQPQTAYAMERTVVAAEQIAEAGQAASAAVDETVTVDYAMWNSGRTLTADEMTKMGPDEGSADESAYLTVMKKETQSAAQALSPMAPVFALGSVPTLGSQGLGSAEYGGYYEFVFSPNGNYGKYNLSFEMKGSATAAKDWTLSYSKDGNSFAQAGDVLSIPEKSKAFPFSVDLPDAANGSSKLYLRLSPGTTAINNGANNKGSNHYLTAIKLTAHPLLSYTGCKPVAFSPAGGEILAGQKITLSSGTEGAEIYYSINGGSFAKYDGTSKLTLSAQDLENGAVVKAYAKKEGADDSVKTKQTYTWAQVGAVKAMPNGGSVLPGTEVTLSCDTQGAAIKYSSDNGTTWQACTNGRLTLTTLPATYLVKAVKEGYKDSAEQTLSYTERQNTKYNIYFGQLHSHTEYSDGAGTCAQAFDYASKAPNLDFLAVTDHSNSFDNEKNATISNGSMSTEWTEGHALADQYTTENFVGIFGYEMTWSNGLGHMNTFNSRGFQSRTQPAYTTYATALQNYYKTLKTEPNSISQFNHPGTTFGDFSDYAHYDEEIDALVTTVEVGNGEGAIGSSGYFPSYEYYQRALDKGWHVAPTNNQDNHKGRWGDSNTGRSVALADSLTRENIYDAMRNYRMYATEDADLNIYYTLDGHVMGSILEAGQTGNTININVELSDATDSSIGEVSVITNGGIVLDRKVINSRQETASFTLNNDYSYYYIKVVQPDGDIAVTAPIWVGEVEAAGIGGLSTSETLPIKGEKIPVKLDLYNNEASAMTVSSITFTQKARDEAAVVHTADLTQAGLTAVAPTSTGSYEFEYLYSGVGAVELEASVSAVLNGAQRNYKGVLKLNYAAPEMVARVLIDGTHYNDYVTGYYGGNVGNFTKVAGTKNVKVEVVKDEITPEKLQNCKLLIISAPAKKKGTANAGAYDVSHFSDEFVAAVKEYTDRGGDLIVCGIADFQDTKDVQSSVEINKLLAGIGATTRINSDQACDDENNGGQTYRLYLKNYKADSKYLKGAAADRTDENGQTIEGQKYSAYSGCTVAVNPQALAAGKAKKLIWGYDTTYSLNQKDDNGNTMSPPAPVVPRGEVTALAYETLDTGSDLFVAGTVFLSDFEVKGDLDNQFSLPFLNRTILENILDDIKVTLPVTDIRKIRTEGQMGDVYTIEGYATSGTSVKDNTFFDAIYVQDDTAGITIFPYSASGLEIGTKVRITGYVDAYQGDKELQAVSSEVLSGEAKKIYEPEAMDAKSAMDYAKSGGKLVKVSGKVTKAVTDGAAVSQFWLDDGSGQAANVFIDGYIKSAATGKNELASIVKEGNTISAAGLVYMHPEGESDVSVACIRVRNCDEIKLVKEASDRPVTPTPDPPARPTPNPTQNPTSKSASVLLNASAITIQKGKTTTALKIKDAQDGDTVKEWTSSDPSIAKVIGNGKIKGIKNGTATITVTMQSGACASCKVTVRSKPVLAKTVKMALKKLKLKKGKTAVLDLILNPITAADLKWKSSNPKVVKVDKNGKVTAKTAGTATITAVTSKGKKASCKITVK